MLEHRKAHVERTREVGKKYGAIGAKKAMRKRKGEIAAPESEEEEVVIEEPAKKGIERELEVKRVGPNPRILVCRYKELAEERECKVRVRDTVKFAVGMRFKMEEPLGEAEYRGVWEYKGVMPRYKGRW